MEARIWQFRSNDDSVITSHNLVICKRFKIRVFIVKNLVMGGKKTNHHCFSSTHMPVLKSIHGSSDATCLPRSLCLHKWERREADDEKDFTWKGVLTLT